MAMKEIDKIAFIYLKDNKILSSRSKGKDTFYIPGGKREKGECDKETLIREIKEELSVDIQENTIKYFDTFKAQAHGHKEGIIVKMTCYFAEYTGELKADNEIEEIVWLEYKDKMLSSPVDQIIFYRLFQSGLLK